MSISGCQSDNSLIAQATTAAAPLTARVDAVPPHAYFVGSAIFHYLGPAFAVLLFARVDVLGIAWLRIASAAVVDEQAPTHASNKTSRKINDDVIARSP